ncbi:MAG: tRNA threonylcarbamoyladenosine dehydratase [Bdellovibrionales bacterium]|nr:tRNA threonylcarbamoyladenosine dehydratase [Bdellovibrionales bacterium]
MSDQEYYDYRFSGIERLYGKAEALKIRKSHVLIVGLGGVGSWVVEALARTGMEKLTLVDFDDICVSNTNRQLHAIEPNVGKMKTQALKTRVESINKNCKVQLIEEPYSPETEARIFSHSYDVVIDCIDKSIDKERMAVASRERNIPIILMGTTGGRRDLSQIKVADLSNTDIDPMLYIIRKSLRKNHGFPRLPKKMNIPTIFSTEKPYYPTSEGSTSQEKPEGFNKPLDCSVGFGTATYITGTFGFIAAQQAIKIILNN